MTEIIRPLADCPHCHGAGFVPSKKTPGMVTTCWCVESQQIRQYLTPEYSSAQYDPDFPLEHFNQLLQHDLLFKNYPLNLFREKIKSFLAKTWNPKGSPKHLTLTAWDTIQACMSNPGYPMTLVDIRAVDILILLLDNDPPNSAYSQYLTFVLKERQRAAKHNLIWSRYLPDSQTFINLYGEPFSQWLLSDEANFHKICPPKFEEEAKPSYVRRA